MAWWRVVWEEWWSVISLACLAGIFLLYDADGTIHVLTL
jgi:hypothetical protein